jgi:PEP-CTERM motif
MTNERLRVLEQMSVRFRKSFYLASTALSLSLVAFAAKADPSLPNLQNLNFNDYTGTDPKGTFSDVNPVGWTGGTGLIFIDGPSAGASAAGPVYLTTYGNPTGSVTGNYVEADGNPSFTSGFNYRVSGLVTGTTYTLSFYQGASEQAGYGLISGQPIPTTDQWIVSLGTSGLTLSSGGPVDTTYGPTDVYSNADPTASIAASPLMSVPYQGTVGWDYVSVSLTADATTDLLSFLAWGDNGSTVNLPPIAFLAGVDSPPGLGSVPEPVSMSLFGVGLAGLGAVARRRRRKSTTTN